MTIDAVLSRKVADVAHHRQIEGRGIKRGRPDVEKERGAGGGSVALPELKAVNTVDSGEVGDAVHVDA